MRLEDYVEKKTCEESWNYRFLKPDDMTYINLSTFFKDLVSASYSIAKGRIITDVILSEVEEKANQLFLSFLNKIKDADCGGEIPARRKKQLFWCFYQRFMKQFYLELLKDSLIITSNLKVTNYLMDSDTKENLYTEVHLVLHKNGGYNAVVLNGGKNSKGLSLNGRSSSTQIECSYKYAFIKANLEDTYPGINVSAVFFQEGESKGIINNWANAGKKESNHIKMNYSSYYENGELDKETLMSVAESVLDSKEKEPKNTKCRYCNKRKDCQMQSVSERRLPTERTGIWTMPTFDTVQKDFIFCNEKNILVCAGPGAGKTASLIGRIDALSNKGIPTEKICLITYTHKAADEIRHRLCNKYADDEMPRVDTLHSIAAEIDRIYAKLYKSKPHNVLDGAAEKELLKRVLNSYENKLTGVSYRSYDTGENSTVAIVVNRLADYRKDSNALFAKYKDFIPEEWEKLDRDFKVLADEYNYITYDEQISNACFILETNKNIATYYHQLYDYIMVDEYQDINEEQDRLITLLTGNNNLACIGDVDQAIYAFKGCSAQYMRDFSKRKADAVIKKMVTNYRSTRHLVNICNDVLKRMPKELRIEKLVDASVSSKEGVKPVLYEDNNPELIDCIIKGAIERGYKYEDIAVVSTTNKDLAILNDTLKAPTELASAFLINDFLFHVILNLGEIVLDESRENITNSYVRLGYIFEENEEWLNSAYNGELPEGEVKNLVAFAKSLKDETPGHFVSRISAYLDMEESPSETEMLSQAMRIPENLAEFIAKLRVMRLYGDTQKVDYPIEDKVTLITAHSCKGMEWKVVICLDTENYKDTVFEDKNSGFDLRLFYVTASRAKEELYFLKEMGTSSIIDSSPLVTKNSMVVA